VGQRRPAEPCLSGFSFPRLSPERADLAPVPPGCPRVFRMRPRASEAAVLPPGRRRRVAKSQEPISPEDAEAPALAGGLVLERPPVAHCSRATRRELGPVLVWESVRRRGSNRTGSRGIQPSRLRASARPSGGGADASSGSVVTTMRGPRRAICRP